MATYHYQPVVVSPSGRLFASRAARGLSWTDDDGQAWISVGSIGETTSTDPWPLYFLRSGIGWGVFYQPTRGGGGAQTIAYSTDDGLTWNHSPRGTQPRIFAVDTRDERTLLGQTRSGEIGSSTDLFTTTSTWAVFASDVRAIIGNDSGSRFWVATADGTLHRTRDGGQTWEIAGLTPRIIRENGLSVSHHDPEALFAINDLGELWYYRDVVGAAPAQVP